MSGSAAWAPLLSESSARMLLTLVEAEMQSRGVPYKMEDGAVDVELGDGPQSLGLHNLAQVCASIPAADWPEAVQAHFDLVFGSAREEAELAAEIADFDRVKSRLRVRLYESPVEAHVSRLVGAGIAAGLVFDLPSAMRSVARAEAELWGRSDEELFDLALGNLSLEQPPETQTIKGPEEVPIVVVEGTSYYTASRALLLEREVIPEGHPYGGLVTVPSRHVFFYHLIEDGRVIYAVNALVSLASEAFRRGPGSISDQVYWARRGELVQIPCGVQDGTLHVAPPTLFLKEVLEPLSQPTS